MADDMAPAPERDDDPMHRDTLHALLDVMVRVAALRNDENSIAVLNQMKRLAHVLPTYFDLPVDAPVTAGDLAAQPAPVRSVDTAMAIHAARQETMAAHQADPDAPVEQRELTRPEGEAIMGGFVDPPSDRDPAVYNPPIHDGA
jgi:hypothetical protein